MRAPEGGIEGCAGIRDPTLFSVPLGDPIRETFVKRTLCDGIDARRAIEQEEKISRRAACALQSASE